MEIINCLSAKLSIEKRGSIIFLSTLSGGIEVNMSLSSSEAVKMGDALKSLGAVANEPPTAAAAPCLCKENGLHQKTTRGKVVVSACVSLVVNKDCPIHGHYMQS
jgi:hypothetical protein